MENVTNKIIIGSSVNAMLGDSEVVIDTNVRNILISEDVATKEESSLFYALVTEYIDKGKEVIIIDCNGVFNNHYCPIPYHDMEFHFTKPYKLFSEQVIDFVRAQGDNRANTELVFDNLFQTSRTVARQKTNSQRREWRVANNTIVDNMVYIVRQTINWIKNPLSKRDYIENMSDETSPYGDIPRLFHLCSEILMCNNIELLEVIEQFLTSYRDPFPIGRNSNCIMFDPTIETKNSLQIFDFSDIEDDEKRDIFFSMMDILQKAQQNKTSYYKDEVVVFVSDFFFWGKSENAINELRQLLKITTEQIGVKFVFNISSKDENWITIPNELDYRSFYDLNVCKSDIALLVDIESLPIVVASNDDYEAAMFVLTKEQNDFISKEANNFVFVDSSFVNEMDVLMAKCELLERKTNQNKILAK